MNWLELWLISMADELVKSDGSVWLALPIDVRRAALEVRAIGYRIIREHNLRGLPALIVALQTGGNAT